MENATNLLAPGNGGGLVPASVTLAFQRIHQTWRLLCLVGLGMLAAIVVICSVPLYTRVAMTASLRATLTVYPENADMAAWGTVDEASPPEIRQLTQSFNRIFQHDLGPYLSAPQMVLTVDDLNLPNGDHMVLTGLDTTLVSTHLTFIQGHAPGSTVQGHTLDIAVRSDIASMYHWQPGTLIPVPVTYRQFHTGAVNRGVAYLRVVGIFNPRNSDDLVLHGYDFSGYQPPNGPFIASALVSNDALLSLFGGNAATSTLPVILGTSISWFYPLDTGRIQIDDVPQIKQGVQHALVDSMNNRLASQVKDFHQYQSYIPTATFTYYLERLPVSQFPIAGLMLMVLGLALFFVMLLTSLLVERQDGPIALLRSRGATRGQIFGALATQAVCLSLLILAGGPFLSIVLARFLVRWTLPGAYQGALNVLDGNPIAQVFSIALFALAVAGVMLLVMILALWLTTNRDVLALRREAARATSRPLWQRLYLDVVGALLALLAAGTSFYLLNTRALSIRLALGLLAPLTLLATLCLLLAALLLALRGFPWLLRAGAWLAARMRGAASLLALAQMARAPRQSTRMTLLLALSTAFAIFALVFNATQTERVQAVTDYRAGADFSGSISSAIAAGVATVKDWQNVTHTYSSLPGVLSASLGYVHTVNAGDAQNSLPVNLQAVDSRTFAQTARWSPLYSSQSLANLLRQLLAARDSTAAQDVVPAIVDANTWNTLHLTQGGNFRLSFQGVSTSTTLKFQAIAEIQQIPTTGDSSLPGILVDYQALAGISEKADPSTASLFLTPNAIWLRTSDDPAQLRALRIQLSYGIYRLSPLYDRRQMVTQLSNDPLYLALFGILLLGAVTVLLLALVGNLTASWLNARSRLASFAALRALGATPFQLASTLAWEQIIVYTAAMILGFLAGWLLAVLALPALIVTSVASVQSTGAIDNAVFYAEQNTPPVHLVIPPALWLALAALVLLYVLALSMMVRVVSRPSMAQVLRLNED